MGTTVPNGAVAQVPYGLLRNINQGLAAVTVVILDSSLKARAQPILGAELNSPEGIPFYTGETIQLIFRAGSQSSNARVCDLWTVNPGTGTEAYGISVYFTAIRQKTVSILVSAINTSTGALTTSASYMNSTYT